MEEARGALCCATPRCGRAEPCPCTEPCGADGLGAADHCEPGRVVGIWGSPVEADRQQVDAPRVRDRRRRRGQGSALHLACDTRDLPILALCDTPGFVMWTEAEKAAQVRRVRRMFVTGGNIDVPSFTVVLRKEHGSRTRRWQAAPSKRPSSTSPGRPANPAACGWRARRASPAATSWRRSPTGEGGARGRNHWGHIPRPADRPSVGRYAVEVMQRLYDHLRRARLRFLTGVRNIGLASVRSLGWFAHRPSATMGEGCPKPGPVLLFGRDGGRFTAPAMRAAPPGAAESNSRPEGGTCNPRGGAGL